MNRHLIDKINESSRNVKYNSNDIKILYDQYSDLSLKYDMLLDKIKVLNSFVLKSENCSLEDNIILCHTLISRMDTNISNLCFTLEEKYLKIYDELKTINNNLDENSLQYELDPNEYFKFKDLYKNVEKLYKTFDEDNKYVYYEFNYFGGDISYSEDENGLDLKKELKKISKFQEIENKSNDDILVAGKCKKKKFFKFYNDYLGDIKINFYVA